VSETDTPSIRVDKWLWYARFLKSRSLASRFVSDGNLRIGGERNVLTFPQGNHTRVIKILEIGTRRGPATEAQTLYEDLSPPENQPREKEVRTGPRPTKRDRRDMNLLRDGG